MQYRTLTLFSPAKLNLTLKIAPTLRADGYHELNSVMQMIDLGDTLRLTVTPGRGETLDLSFDAPCQPLLARRGDLHALQADLESENNLLLKSRQLWTERYLPAKRAFAWHWHLAKATPTGAGLGGGSSNAAAALKLLTAWALAEGILDTRTASSRTYRQELHDIAAELGSDVPFFLLESPRARATGRGEILTALPPVADAYLLIFPEAPAETARAYARLDQCRREREEAAWRDLDNDFLLLYREEERAIREAFGLVSEKSLSLSGSGSTFFLTGTGPDVSRCGERAGFLTWPCRALCEVPKVY